MKKILIATSAMALSGAVWAQSSVTLYGVADIGVQKVEGTRFNMISGAPLNNSDSYIGFRGEEDLGRGLKAGFKFEQAINMEDGSTFERLHHTFWRRASNVWLSGNWGKVRLGNGTTPSFHAMEAWDLMGLANYSPAILNLGFVGGDSRDREPGLVSYKTPAWGGFSAEIGYIFKALNNKKSKLDLGFIYANDPVSVGFAFNKGKNLKTNYGFGVKYNFGAFTLAASYQDSKNWAYGYFLDPNGIVRTRRIKGVTLGGSANFGAFGVALDLERPLKDEAVYQGVLYKQKKYTNGVLELKYALSKRTSFYGVYQRRSANNGYALGLQHKF